MSEEREFLPLNLALMTIFRPNMDGRVASFELTRAE